MKITKYTKRLVSIVLSTLMVISVPTIAFAKEVAGTTPVSYVEDTSYTVSIPRYTKAQEYGEAVNTAANTVRIVSAQLNDETTLVGTVSYSGVMTEQRGATIPYKLVDESGDVASGSTIITHKAGTPDTEEYKFGVAVTEKAKYSGTYSDTAVFSFDVKDKTYTAEEIAADEHLYAIGKNKAEWVVAKFNNDYSSVTVLANGEDSDGIMKDYQTLHPYYDANATESSFDTIDNKSEGRFMLKEQGMQNTDFLNSIGEASPMAKHSFTLNTAIIKPGVKNIGAGAFLLYDYSKAVNWDENYQKTLREKYSHEDGTMGLRHISIADTVEKIGDCAFLNNTGLRCNKYSTTPTSIVIPSSVKTIGKFAFTIQVPGSYLFTGFNYDKIGVIGLDELYLPITFNEGLETIDELAFACAGTVATPKEKISDMSNINASQFNTSFPETIKDIKAGAFSSTCVIGNMTISGNVGAYAFDGRVFDGNADWQAEALLLNNVTIKGNVDKYAFAWHNNIDTINLLDGCASVGEGVFSSYRTLNIGSGLKDFNSGYLVHSSDHYNYIPGSFSNFKATYKTDINIDEATKKIAARCQTINVSADNPYFTSLDGVLFNKDITKLLLYPAGKTSTKYGYEVPKTVKEIVPCAFQYTTLDKMLMPSSVTNIAGNGLKEDYKGTLSAFYKADKLPQTIYGVSGSYAQTWADNNKLQFIDCQDAYRGPQTVTVSYDSNGGKGYMPSYTVVTKEPFNKMEFTLALRTPFTKEGYEFAGWAFRNNVTGEYLKNEGQIITISAADLEQMAAEVGDSYTIPAEDNFIGYDGSCYSYSVVAQWTAK